MAERTIADELRAALDAAEEPADAGEDTANEVDPGDAVQAGPEVAEPVPDADAGADELPIGDRADEAPAKEAPGVEAPEHWSADHKAIFETLPDDETRKRFVAFETERTRGVERKLHEAAEFRRESEELRQMMAPFEQELSLHGLTRMDGIRRLVAAEGRLRTDPGGGLEWLARQYGRSVAGTDSARETIRRIADVWGVDLSGLNGAADPQTPEARRLAALESRLAEQDRAREQAWVAQQTQVTSSATQTIREFAEARDAKGQPAHPHFDAVKVHMGALMQSGAAQDLADAYDRAVWAVPELRESLVKARQNQTATEAEAARKIGVAKAKAAQTPRTASAKATSAEDDTSKRSIRESLEAAFAEQESASRARI